jgi:hypothetical protein
LTGLAGLSPPVFGTEAYSTVGKMPNSSQRSCHFAIRDAGMA